MNEESKASWDDQVGQSAAKPELAELEERAKSLMQGILSSCEMLKLRKDQGSKLTISSLCHELSAVRDQIIQFMEAMEFNAHRLQGQNLETPEAEIRLRRAAEIAWAELNRLSQFIEEIDRALTIANEILFESDKFLGQRELRQEWKHFYDLDLIREIHPAPDGSINSSERHPSFGEESPSNCKLTPPLLGLTPSLGLEASLKKVPAPSPRDVKIHADPYTKGLYMNDTHSGRVELNYDLYDPVAGSMATEALYGGPIMAQAGFDGSYTAHGPGGLLASFRPSPLGDL